VATSRERGTREGLRDELAALRLDRDARQPRKLSARALAAICGGSALVLLAILFAVYLATWGRTLEVRVDYAKRSAAPLAGAPGTVTPSLTGSGYIVTGTDYLSLGVRVPGRIVAYLVDEGDRVKKGQELVRLDERPYRAQLQRAEAQQAVARANVELRRKELERLRALHEREVAAQSELDIKENQLRVAEAEVASRGADIAQIRLDLEDTVLRSPVEGVVLEKFKEVGEIAVPGGFSGSGDLIRLANLAEMRAQLDVNESDLAKVSLGQDAEVSPDADSSRRYAARVVKLAPQINRQKGTLRVEVRILEPDAWLRPDMSARITFLEAAAPVAQTEGQPSGDVVWVAASALRRDEAGAFVWVVREGQLRRQPVEAGPRSDDRVLIRSGLLGGEAVVVTDSPELRDGRSVHVMRDPAAGRPAATRPTLGFASLRAPLAPGETVVA
jgi:RND family efflux transporter MFP subunit